MPDRRKTLTIDRTALKALVTLFGPREAARQAGIPAGTVLKMAFKFGWKKAMPVESNKDAGDVIAQAIQNSKKISTVHLAKFTERAAMHAAEAKEPLEIARKVRDVAYVHSTLWPNEKAGGMIEGAILIGAASVTDAQPFQEKNVEGMEVIDTGDDTLPEELPDSGPAGD